LEGQLLFRLNRALEEGCVTNNGPYVQDFEAVLSRYLRVPTICFSSGQAALTALLMAHDVKDKEVIYPAFTFPATPNAILSAGGKPVACDIDPVTLMIDPEDVKRKIRPSTAAILAVDVYGMCSISPQLLDVAIMSNAPILVDAAPSFGTHIMAKPSTYLAPSIYSFHATKQLAVGEGGCLSSDDPEIIDKCKKIRNFGLHHGNWVMPGINGKMTEISALIGLENMKTFQARVICRRAVKQKLDEAMMEVSHVRTIPEPKGQLVSWLYCPILIEDGAAVSRDGVINLLMDRGIQTREYYGSCSSYTPVANSYTPVADDIASRVIALPCYESLTDDEIGYIRDSMKDILGARE
jgi:dTDP-4-amino-4,6-dideoxyglucose